MKFSEFERVWSQKRLRKYLNACGGDRRNALTLYRLNLRLSQEIFTVISCFEVALRNAIDREMVARWGDEWLKDFSQPGGVFYKDVRTKRSRNNIDKAFRQLMQEGTYSHSKLLAEMEFGFWKYLMSGFEYRLTGRILLKAFPNKPRSTPSCNIDNTFIFTQLDFINNLRNRVAHHEPVCFDEAGNICTFYALSRYRKMIQLFEWMDIDHQRLLYGLDHVLKMCTRLDNFARKTEKEQIKSRNKSNNLQT